MFLFFDILLFRNLRRPRVRPNRLNAFSYFQTQRAGIEQFFFTRGPKMSSEIFPMKLLSLSLTRDRIGSII